MIKPVCEECGSDNLRMEAPVEWDGTEFVAQQSLCYSLCWECDDECFIKFVEVEDEQD